MRARLGMLGLTATAAAAAAAPASATHIPSATYTGTFGGAGSVVFDVSADGTAVTRIVYSLPLPCGSVNTLFQGSVPILDHAFTYQSGGTTFRGLFRAGQSAEGTMQEQAACIPTSPSWTATTSAPPSTLPDTTRPVITLAGSRSQRAGRPVTVRATSNEAATANAGGVVRIRRSRRTVTRGLQAVTAQLAPGVATPLRLAVPDRTQRTITRALRNGRRVTAVVTVIVLDAAKNSAVQSRTIRLRRR